MNEYGVYIHIEDIDAIVNMQEVKQGDNLFANLKDNDNVVFA